MNLKSIFIGSFLSICSIISANAQALPDFTTLVDDLVPTTVSITIELDIDNPEFEDAQLTAPKVSSGSGFIISNDGYIVTNKHVIDQAKTISITTNDNKNYKAQIIGTDDKTDIALLKVSEKNDWKPVVFGDSDKIKVGEWILAVGNPFGFGNSVTKGIISAKSRDIDSGNYDNFIQTDASINRGNSGGPMFNMQGELIGINTAIFSTTGNSMGIGFAIPINLIKWVINELKTKGEVERGWVGIGIQPTSVKSSTINSANKNENEEYAVVVSVLTDNAPAQKSGIKVGDIITSFNGAKIDDTKNLSRIIAETKIGKIAKFDIIRTGKKLAINVKIEKMPPNKKPQETTVENSYKENTSVKFDELGFSVTEVENELIISSVEQLSDAAIKGLIVGDKIIKADKNNVFRIEDIKKHINEAKIDNNRPIMFQIQTDDTNHFVTIELKKND